MLMARRSWSGALLPVERKRELMEAPHKSRRFKLFLNLRAVIFAVCLINVAVVSVMTFVRIREWEFAHPTGSIVSHTYPVLMLEPFLLLGAAICLLINRWWSVWLALLATMRVIYLAVYFPWTAVYWALGIPMLSLQAVKTLWVLVYEPHPRYLVAAALAIGMFAYAVLLSARFVYFRAVNPRRRDCISLK